MEIPDPAVEIIISLPRRGKIRTLSPEDCDELIVAAARAKSMHLAALAALQPQEPPRGSHPYPAPAARAAAESMPPGAANAICSHPGCGHPGSVHYLLSPHDHGCNQCEDQRYTAQRAITGAAIAAARTEATDGPVCNAGSPDGERFRCTRMPGHDSLHVALGSEGSDSEPVTWPQGQQSYSGTACLVVSGHGTVCIADHAPHAGPHKDMWGFEWWGSAQAVADEDEAGAGTRCGARPYPPGSEGDDGTECILPAGHDGPHDDGPEPYPATDGLQCLEHDGDWACGAQRGHGGPDHLAYAAGEIRHRWPVSAVPHEEGDVCPYYEGDGGPCRMCGHAPNLHEDGPDVIFRAEPEASQP